MSATLVKPALSGIRAILVVPAELVAIAGFQLFVVIVPHGSLLYLDDRIAADRRVLGRCPLGKSADGVLRLPRIRLDEPENHLSSLAAGFHDGDEDTDRGRLAAGNRGRSHGCDLRERPAPRGRPGRELCGFWHPAAHRGCALSRSARMERCACDRVRDLSHLYCSGRVSCGAQCKVDAAQATIEFVSGRLAFAPDRIAEPMATVTEPAQNGHRVGELERVPGGTRQLRSA